MQSDKQTPHDFPADPHRRDRGVGSVSSDTTAAAPSGAVGDVEAYGQRGDAGWSEATEGRITGTTGKGLKARYALMGIHATLVLVVLIISAVFTGNAPLLIIHCYLLFAAVVYLPMTVWVNVTRRKMPWDSASAEIAYLAVQLLGWSVSALWHTLIYATANQANSCEALVAYQNAQGLRRLRRVFAGLCSGSITSFSLGYAHLVLLAGWLIFDLLAVYAATRGRAGSAMSVGMGWVLRGWGG